MPIVLIISSLENIIEFYSLIETPEKLLVWGQ